MHAYVDLKKTRLLADSAVAAAFVVFMVFSLLLGTTGVA
jgi:hypothetical protein